MKNEKLLRVKGQNFCAAIIFRKEMGQWRIFSIAPILRKIIGNAPVAEIGKILTAKNCRYEWM